MQKKVWKCKLDKKFDSKRQYQSNLDKPIKEKIRSFYKSEERNMKKIDYSDKSLFTTSDEWNYNGFCGVSEYENFPLRSLFLKSTGKIPNEWDTGYFKYTDLKKFAIKHKSEIIAAHYEKNADDMSACAIRLKWKEDVIVYFYNRVSWDFDSGYRYGVAILFGERTKKVDKLISFFKKIVIPDEEKLDIGHINILEKTINGYELEQKEIKCPDIDFDINYNEDFKPIHELIKQKLSLDKSKGLVLLHGEPGTGKTTYIRYLANNIQKKIIYIPPNMISVLSDPELIKFFITNSNTILLIEDAENILMKRQNGSTQAIANLLNLTDGLLSDCTNIQVVATFNTELSNIDKALLRKGRLIAKYEFKELSEDRAKKLCEKLNVKMNKKQTLAEIYNSEESSFIQESEKIGFKLKDK